ncbi:MAG: peptidoglycan-N-acetylglucosamine deacetylase [Abditibacteriota bacterium]|nr:peptidoglycan-N-acetylglucosamine deacetylase [Abditibacteriota bacterium]
MNETLTSPIANEPPAAVAQPVPPQVAPTVVPAATPAVAPPADAAASALGVVPVAAPAAVSTATMVSEVGSTLSQSVGLVRVAAFVCATITVWIAYFLWRPPAPMLFLRHTEHMGRETPAISINFDDAPHPVMTPLLLAALNRADAKATFFVIGDSLRLYPELARRIVQEGHTLANHSQNHHNLSRQSPTIFKSEIEPCFAAIRRTYKDAGVPMTTRLFRPPGGGMNRPLMQYLYDHDIELAWWSNNMGDWAKPPAWKIADQVNANLRPGDIILLHDTPGGYGTPQAIPAIVRAARRQNLKAIAMPEKGAL